VGFKNELIGQSNFPHRPSRPTCRRAWPILSLPAGSLGRLGNSVPARPPPAGICRQPFGLGKVESWAYAGARTGCGFAISRIAQGGHLAGCRVHRAVGSTPGRQPLTVFRCNFTLS
jgi:hypothetical protein